MRNAFADEITRAAAADPRVVMLSGDIGNKLFDRFKDACPDRFVNCGVAEANMIGVASGLALSGMRPVAYTITPFITTRVLEQIRLDVCYHDVPVVIVGVGSGLGYASLGPTHHSCEDMAFLRALPGMTVLAPADAAEVRGCLRAALAHPGPVYMRIGKKGEPAVHTEVPAITIGRSLVLREGTDVCLLGVGTLLPEVLAVAERLAGRGISACVVSAVSVKPLDEDRLRDAFDRFPLVATIEEHSLIGGFGAAVAEWLADRPAPGRGRLLRFGTQDHFIHEAGEVEHARHLNGLTVDAMTDRILGALAPAA
ncbi:transketolase family protein [Azospirillum halopraeferens]|uniref:transketolase family protein n=1 Tax=Azospirillum halopraeferens TaxID=34010 RepID=UPI00040ED905|nr:transketolase C-terminal domain-containing protein [Azospirillum halopraeferens]